MGNYNFQTDEGNPTWRWINWENGVHLVSFSHLSVFSITSFSGGLVSGGNFDMNERHLTLMSH